MELSQETRDWIELIAFIVFILSFIVLIYFAIRLNTDSAKCVADPIGYYEGLKNVTCMCNKF